MSQTVRLMARAVRSPRRGARAGRSKVRYPKAGNAHCAWPSARTSSSRCSFRASTNRAWNACSNTSESRYRNRVSTSLVPSARSSCTRMVTKTFLHSLLAHFTNLIMSHSLINTPVPQISERYRTTRPCSRSTRTSCCGACWPPIPTRAGARRRTATLSSRQRDAPVVRASCAKGPAAVRRSATTAK